MKPGDLYLIRVPMDAHPRYDYLDGKFFLILGESFTSSGLYGTRVAGFCGERTRTVPVRWLTEVRSEDR
jgi:hypothetical protein